jgi:hypothetical protein
MSTLLSLERQSSRLPYVMLKRSSRYALTNARAAISSDILAWKMSGEHPILIGSCREEYFPHGNIMVHILDESGSNVMV